MKAIAVIPAYNESRHIVDVVKATKRHVDEVIVVDDSSSDGTADLAFQAGAIVMSHAINLGKASALKTGCDAAVARQPDVVVLLDADGQHDPELIPEFLRALDDQTDIVFGTRRDLGSMPLVRRLGTELLELSMKRLFHMNLHDMQCGYRAFRPRVYPTLRWYSRNYHADAEVTARVGKYRLRYKEIPISTIYHDEYKGMTIIDGMTLLGKLFIWRFSL